MQGSLHGRLHAQNLGEHKHVAVKGGFSEFQEARSQAEDFGLETLGVSYQIVSRGSTTRSGTATRRRRKVYVVMSGSGTCHLDDEVVEVKRLDAIGVGRALPAASRPEKTGSS